MKKHWRICQDQGHGNKSVLLLILGQWLWGRCTVQSCSGYTGASLADQSSCSKHNALKQNQMDSCHGVGTEAKQWLVAAGKQNFLELPTLKFCSLWRYITKFEMKRNMNVYKINILYNILQEGVDGIILHLKLYKFVSPKNSQETKHVGLLLLRMLHETLVFHTIIVTVKFKIGNFEIKFKTMKYSHTIRYKVAIAKYKVVIMRNSHNDEISQIFWEIKSPWEI